MGWNVVNINKADELRFIEQAHIHAYDQRAYWIGGTSDKSPGSGTLGLNLTNDGNAFLSISCLVNKIKLKLQICSYI